MTALHTSRDQVRLALTAVAGTVLREIGLETPGAAEAWAGFWLAEDEGAALAEPARQLAEILVDDRWPLSAVAQAFGRIAQIEAALGGQPPQGMDRLVLLLATVEGLQVCLMPAAPPAESRAAEEIEALVAATAALNQALRQISRREGAGDEPAARVA